MSITIATVNVNGIRAAFRKGMDTWLSNNGADVVLLQEVRAPEDIASSLMGEEWESSFLPSQLKGRAGVGIACRKTSGIHFSARETDTIETKIPEDTGRWLEAELTVPGRDRPLHIVSAYLHSGQVNSPKLKQKLSHFTRVEERLHAIAENADSDALVAGDFNVVRSPLDIKNWSGNHNKTSGVLDKEIAFLDRWFDHEWVDVTRRLHGAENQGPYTWWSQRGKAFDNNAGWRIDYQMATPRLAEGAHNMHVDRAASYAERWSDHAPLVISYR